MFPTPYADYDEEPQPKRCGCGKDWPWSWHEPHVNGVRYAGRWAAPPVNPCPICRRSDDDLHEDDVRGRLVAAGLPNPLVAHRLDDAGLVLQGEQEPVDAFRVRVQEARQDRPVLGVSIAQRKAYKTLRHWRPPQWLVLHGPPGTGKTTLMAALARRAMNLRPDRWEVREGRRTLVRSRRHAVEYHRLDDVIARERVKMRGLDEAPVRDVARVGVSSQVDSERAVTVFDDKAVLFLDELGLSPRPPDAEQRLVERIIGYRAEQGLCTVVATNRAYHEVAGPDSIYGRRVGDRLRAALDVQLTGDSWRGA